MSDRLPITLEFIDGKTSEFSTSTYMCTADRVAFERHYHTSSAVLSRGRDTVDDDGNIKPDADLNSSREEWLVFLVWCAATRETGQWPEFEDFASQIARIQFAGESATEDEEAPASDPLDQTPPPAK